MVKKGLGSGLDALFGEKPLIEEQNAGEKVLLLAVEAVRPNPAQPRRSFDEGKLKELAASVKEQGVLQPILVRPEAGKHGRYEIVAGERRWRAAKLAGLEKIPAIVKPLDDGVSLEVALNENIQRAELNPLEEAASFRELMDKYGYTQAGLAERLGKSRVYVANTLRLLGLPERIREMIGAGRISAGHGKALLMLESEADRLALAERIREEGLSVRQAEAMAKEPAKIYAAAKTTPKPPKTVIERPLERPIEYTREQLLLRDLADKLCHRMKTKVVVEQKKKGGRITLEYYSEEELERLIELLLPGVTF